MAKGKYARKRMRKQLRETSLSQAGLSTRVVNVLEKANIHSLSDLMIESETAISQLPGIGEAAMEEIREIKNKYKA